jgi:hypothetical protein
MPPFLSMEVNRNELGLDPGKLAEQMTAWRYHQ